MGYFISELFPFFRSIYFPKKPTPQGAGSDETRVPPGSCLKNNKLYYSCRHISFNSLYNFIQ